MFWIDILAEDRIKKQMQMSVSLFPAAQTTRDTYSFHFNISYFKFHLKPSRHAPTNRTHLLDKPTNVMVI